MAWLSQKTKRRLEKKAGHLVVQCSLFAMLLGFAYVILYPFLFKILASFMSLDDMYDPTVMLIPKNWTLDIYRGLLQTPDYVEGFYHTTLYRWWWRCWRPFPPPWWATGWRGFASRAASC